MKPSSRKLASALGVLLAGVLGAGISLAVAAGLGDLRTKTVVTERVGVTPVSTGSSSSSGTGLSIPAIYERTAPGVVEVTSTSIVKTPSNPFFQFPSQTETALGSGFVIDKQGHIVTNYHVIKGATAIKVTFSNNALRKATVVGIDKSTDVAVLKVNISSDALVPLSFGDSAAVRVGDPVEAIGNPFGLDRSITAGIISAVYNSSTTNAELQQLLLSASNFPITDLIQTDAAINHGNSGGPLLNGLGQVIGINWAIDTGNTGQEGNVGIGFAIPSDTVKQVVAQLIKSGKATHAYLGVGVLPISPALASLFRLPTNEGLLVDRVFAGTGAAKAGIKSGSTKVTVSGMTYRLGGDIIIGADGQSVGSSRDKLESLIAAHKPGDKIAIEIYRGSKKMTVSVTLGNRS